MSKTHDYLEGENDDVDAEESMPPLFVVVWSLGTTITASFIFWVSMKSLLSSIVGGK